MFDLQIRRMDLSSWLRAVAAAMLMVCALTAVGPAGAQGSAQDDEIVASLTGGRVIVHAIGKEVATFVAIDEPVEPGAAPPRVINVDATHVAVIFGASEWRVPADPKPIRLDKTDARIGGAADPRYRETYVEAEPDLERIGVAFLEKVSPLAAKLHHKVDFPAEQPLVELVVIGFGPGDYGPEVWTVEYRMAQSEVSSRGDFWQTRVLRPRFTQVYPPDKKAPHKMVEVCYPESCKGPTLQQLIEGNEPTLGKLAASDAKMAKSVDFISRGQAQKAEVQASMDFLRAAIPLIYPGKKFVMGSMQAQRGFDWIVPPDEPVERAKDEKPDKDRPPEAPTLRKRVTPNPPQPQ